VRAGLVEAVQLPQYHGELQLERGSVLDSGVLVVQQVAHNGLVRCRRGGPDPMVTGQFQACPA
jgi:hypothetical protein